VAVKQSLLKQSSPKLWLGAIQDLMQRTRLYYGLLVMPLLLVTVYTVREPMIQKYLPWLTLPVFLGVAVVGMFVVAVVDYKLVKPSVIAFHQHEAYKHRNLIRRDLEAEREAANQRQEQLTKRIGDIEKRLEEILEALNDKTYTHS